MDFPHRKREGDEYGHSPGNGITPIPLSSDPIATEGEATPGPDEYNPYEDHQTRSNAVVKQGEKRDPTKGDDPFAFDDVGGDLEDRGIPTLHQRPELPFDL